MRRRQLLKAGLAGAAFLAWPRGAYSKPQALAIEEATLDDFAKAMAAGVLTSKSLTDFYLARIASLNTRGPGLHAVIEVNPEAGALAAALDAERKSKGPRGPLHGIPVLIKDNIDTADKMATTAGSLALEGVPTVGDAQVVTSLRAAGAVILGKANLSEWANLRSTQSTSGWSARGGLTRNPYALDRTASGSSSGSAVAVAANLCAVPTVGLVSRTGIIPISASQDTAGPMARTVRDAALLLNAMAGDDARDPATRAPGRKVASDYAAGLSAQGLAGARLGVVRALIGTHAQTTELAEAALEDLKRLGATVMDVKIPTGSPVEDPELLVLLYEFKDGLERYFAERRPKSPVKTLAELIAFNKKNAAREMPTFGQELFEMAQAKGPLTSCLLYTSPSPRD